MHHSASRHVRLMAILAATALLASCGDGASEANEATATEADANVMLEQLGNDASALEAASNAAPMETINDSSGASESSDGAQAPAGNSSQPVFGETAGGDTGGNIVQGNVTGQ